MAGQETRMARDDGTGVTRLVSEHAASLASDVLPPELVELIKQIVLDTMGVAIGASGLAPEARIVAEYVEALGGRPESTVLGFGFKAPTPWAAFVNGSLGHMLDYDDVGAGGHVGIATVPVAFTQVSGSRQMAVGASSDLRSMQAGFSGQGAVLAAELAARGIVGSKEIIEGRYGIYKTYVRNEPAWSALTEGLGISFPLLN